MVKLNSIARFSSITSRVILTQTDTTVGFLSQDADKLREVKSRAISKHFIGVYKNFKALKKAKIRVPNSQKAKVRRALKTTFIVKNSAFRVASDTMHSSILRNLQWNHSTSANESGKDFNRDFCEEKADIIVEDKNALVQNMASSLYILNSKKMKRLR